MSTVNGWSDLGFANFQQVLDEQSSKINTSQEEGRASRRALATQTKAFRKLEDEEKLGEIRTLLKNYQTEIDSLTHRCKFAESCFMSVYRSLAMLPDPSSLLDSQSMEITKLKSELEAKSTETENSESDSRIARELERHVLRVAQLEKQLAATKRSGGGKPTSTLNQSKLDELENELAEYKYRCAKAESEAKDQTAVAEKSRADLQKSLAQLAVRQDYDALKEEVRELRGARDTMPDVETSTGELVEMRKQIKQLEADNKQLSEERAAATAEAEQARGLVAKLEDDLSQLQSNDTFSTISGWTAVPRGSGGAPTAGTTIGGASAVSGIITQQRDRYKRRAQELEEKAHHTTTELQKVKKELEALKTDRRALYERVRHLQAAAPNQALPAASATLYEPTTEQKLKELELDRRLVGLHPVDAKILTFCARTVVDNKFRYGIVGYAGLLHVIALAGIIF